MKDVDGILVPNDSTLVEIDVKGEGRLISAGNANPKIGRSFQDNSMRLYKGRG